tara:strand:+ start:110 stop:517 length:408 start_codon:yes stop_codon:yes gene_type:complete
MKISKKEIDKLISEELKNALNEGIGIPDLDPVLAAEKEKRDKAAEGGGEREETSREKAVAQAVGTGTMTADDYFGVLEKTLTSSAASAGNKAIAFARLLTWLKVPDAAGIAEKLKTALSAHAKHGTPKGVTYRKK